jgi:hypothetical protein
LKEKGMTGVGEWVAKALVIGFAAWVIWSVLQPRYVFAIRIQGGLPYLRKGKVTRAFLSQVAVVCRESGVARGWIGGVPHGRRVALRFSRHFPPGPQQRLRNEWLSAG